MTVHRTTQDAADPPACCCLAKILCSPRVHIGQLDQADFRFGRARLASFISGLDRRRKFVGAPIFISGFQRAGTRSNVSTLGRHPGIIPATEINFAVVRQIHTLVEGWLESRQDYFLNAIANTYTPSCQDAGIGRLRFMNKTPRIELAYKGTRIGYARLRSGFLGIAAHFVRLALSLVSGANVSRARITLPPCGPPRAPAVSRAHHIKWLDTGLNGRSLCKQGATATLHFPILRFCHKHPSLNTCKIGPT